MEFCPEINDFAQILNKSININKKKMIKNSINLVAMMSVANAIKI